MRSDLMNSMRVGALVGVIVGVALTATLWVRAGVVADVADAGAGLQYFTTYALMLGMPLTVAASTLVQLVPSTSGDVVLATLTLSLLGNWALVGAGVAFIYSRFRRKA